MCAFTVSPLPLEECGGWRGLGAGSIFLLLREKSQDRSSCPSCQALPATTAPVPLFLFCCPHMGLWPRALSEMRGQEVSEAVPGAWGCGCSLTPSGLGQTEEALSAEGASLGEGARGRELLLLSFQSGFSWFYAHSRCRTLLTGSCSSHKIYFPQIPYFCHCLCAGMRAGTCCSAILPKTLINFCRMHPCETRNGKIETIANLHRK